MSTTPPQPDPGEPTTLSASFFPVAIDALDAQELELDLYLLHGEREPVLYRSVGSDYTMADCAKLATQGIKHLYVPTGQHRVFQRIMTQRAVRAYEDPALERAERCRIVRGSCAKLIEDLMTYPEVEGIAESIGEMAARFSAWCVEDEDRFSHLMDMSEHDFYTATHMVNVGVGCGMLAAELMGLDASAPALRDIVHGGLVHDVGKRTVAPETLNKEGKLTEFEWEQIRGHPLAGVAILTAQGVSGLTAIAMTRDHHERLDGHGYPAGLKASEIGVPARVCSVVDIFDAMTSARPYRGAIPPFRVLESMREEAGTVIDRSVFEAWSGVVERLVQRDPGRCVQDRPGLETPKLRMVIPSEPKQATLRPDAAGSPKAPREQACDVPVLVRFTPARTPEGDHPFPGRVVQLGRGTLRLEFQTTARAGQTLRLEISGRPALDVVVRAHRYGPAGEAILDCVVLTGRRAAG